MSRDPSEEELRLVRAGPAIRWQDYISPWGLASIGTGLALWLYAQNLGGRAQELEGAMPVEKLQDLYKLHAVLPTLVAVRGRVNTDDPRKCELSDKQAVIHEVVEEQIWRKQRNEGRSVYEPHEIRKVFEQAEWFLDDGSPASPRITVENAAQADRLVTAMEVKQVFIPEDFSQKSALNLVLEKAWQMTKHGVRKTERYLPMGAVVTVIGELHENPVHAPAHGQRHLTGATAAASSSAGGSAGAAGSTALSSAAPAAEGGGSASASGRSWLDSARHLLTTPLAALLRSGSGSSSAGGGSSGASSSGQGAPESAAAAAAASPEAASPSPPPSQPASLSASSVGDSVTPGSASTSSQPPHPLTSTPLRPLVLRRPASGGPWYITPLTAEQLHAQLSRSARNCKRVALGLGAVGLLLIARRAVGLVIRLMHRRAVRRRIAEEAARRKARQLEARAARQQAAGAPDAAGGASSSAAASGDAHPDAAAPPDNGSLHDRDPDTCVVCLDAPVEMVFVACGHMCCCPACGWDLYRCPICRTRSRSIKVFKP